MPLLPTEAAPLKVCRHCGSGVPPATEKGMFVHGVGAVGFQSCPRCGARWQYLWYGKHRRVRPGRWAAVGAVSVLMVGVLTVCVVAAMAITRTPDTPERARFSRGTIRGNIADATDYMRIVGEANLVAAATVSWLSTTPTATAAEIETRVRTFERSARAVNGKLTQERWPPRAQAHVDELVAANQDLIEQIDLARRGVRRGPAFTQKLAAKAAAVGAAANLVRRDLDLLPA